ncbi:Clp protease N-terminal domain-containing protein [Euzebya tangerina]|uniref:Clp protease N-terminal domain-containing protein n=1 Tax=Euzebya tangerina TaxID=591198 RepID=UPI000E323D22|nr:Clp protease N-terminal domain-containing protein [Euzebya tangerina]
MFERFTEDAREVVVEAQRIGRERGERAIDEEHLLLALLVIGQPLGGALLTTGGLTAAAVRERMDRSDEQLLATLGVDVEVVRARMVRTFGEAAVRRLGRHRRGGHIPFTSAAKTLLERSLREALARKDRHIGPEHIVLAMFRRGGRVAADLREAGITRSQVEVEVDRVRRAA